MGARRSGIGLRKHEIRLPTLHPPTQPSDGNAPRGTVWRLQHVRELHKVRVQASGTRLKM